MQRKRLGLVGFGYIARFIYQAIQEHPEWGLDIAFVWNRSPGALAEIPEHLTLQSLADFANRKRHAECSDDRAFLDCGG